MAKKKYFPKCGDLVKVFHPVSGEEFIVRLQSVNQAASEEPVMVGLGDDGEKKYLSSIVSDRWKNICDVYLWKELPRSFGTCASRCILFNLETHEWFLLSSKEGRVLLQVKREAPNRRRKHK